MEFDQFTINEIDFLTKQQNLATILPSYTEERVYNLIQGDFGPFKPNIPAQVPLWLAIHLKRSNKCRIVPPDWLTVQTLSDVVTNEKEKEELQNLPFHFFEMAHILLNVCDESISNIQKVRSLLEDIEEIRQTKIDSKMAKIDKNTKYLKLTNISQFEINKSRRVFELLFDGLNNILKTVEKKNVDPSELILSQNLSQNGS